MESSRVSPERAEICEGGEIPKFGYLYFDRNQEKIKSHERFG